LEVLFHFQELLFLLCSLLLGAVLNLLNLHLIIVVVFLNLLEVLFHFQELLYLLGSLLLTAFLNLRHS
jgi:hypothetical protein